MFFVYALYSPKFHKIYIGFTSNLSQRLISNNKLATKGYTLNYRPWIVIYTEASDNKKVAMKREKQLKSAKGRTFVWSLVKQKH